MNILALDKDPEKAAEYHCDKNVVEMVYQTVKILSTVHWYQLIDKHKLNLKYEIIDSNNNKIFKRTVYYFVKNYFLNGKIKDTLPPYKATNVNHPSIIWAKSSKSNYIWLTDLFYYLCKEYNKRYNKTHKLEQHVDFFKKNVPYNLPKKGLQEFATCMDDVYKISKDPIVCYKNYCYQKKYKISKWNYSKKPEWFENYSIYIDSKLDNICNIKSLIGKVANITSIKYMPLKAFFSKNRTYRIDHNFNNVIITNIYEEEDIINIKFITNDSKIKNLRYKKNTNLYEKIVLYNV